MLARWRRGVAGSLTGLALGCQGPTAKPEAPAKVENPVAEGALPAVRLTEAAIDRLGLEFDSVQSRVVGAVRTVGGEVIAPPGWAVRIDAPLAGIVGDRPPLPAVGSFVAAGTVLVRLVPLGPQADAVRGAEDTAVAQARVSSARAEAERIRALHRDGLASTRDLERADADLRAAEAVAQAAAARVAGFEGSRAEGGLGAVAVRAPLAGRVTALEVTAGATVAAGAPIVSLLRAGRLWIKVPLFAGDLGHVDRTAPAAVRPLGLGAADRPWAARPVAGPPSANTANASVDLYYELAQVEATLRPGERVDVAVPLRGGGAKQLVVPWSAVVRDAQGGAWVYQRTSPTTFARQGVIIRSLVGDWVVLDRGPAPGTVVVTVGAAELFGTEFGTGK